MPVRPEDMSARITCQKFQSACPRILPQHDAFRPRWIAGFATKYSVSGARPRITPASGLPAARGAEAAARVAAEKDAASIGVVA